MNDRDEHIVNSLRRWIQGDIDQKEENRLDRQAREDDFLGEALDGYRRFPGSKHQERLERMREQLQSHTGKRKKRGALILGLPYRIAAAAAIVLAVGVFWWLNPTSSTDLAQAEPTRVMSTETEASESAPAVVEDQAEDDLAALEDRSVRPESADAENEPRGFAAKREDTPTPPEKKENKPVAEPATANYAEELPVSRSRDSVLALDDQNKPAPKARQSMEEGEVPVAAPPPPPAPPPPGNNIALSQVQLNAPQGTRLVTGQVIDRAGTPLKGVVVVTPGDRTGTITNINGQYEILLDSNIQDLEFQRTGYSAQRVNIPESQDFVRVTLDESAATVDGMIEAREAAKKTKDDGANPNVHASSINLNIAEPEISLKRFERNLRRNLEYPAEAISQGISGSVTLRFTIMPDGRVVNVQAVSGPELLRTEAIRLIEMGPNWKITNGGERSITFTYRLDFSL